MIAVGVILEIVRAVQIAVAVHVCMIVSGIAVVIMIVVAVMMAAVAISPAGMGKHTYRDRQCCKQRKENNQGFTHI